MSKELLQLTEEELKTKSQATYFFDCTNSWFSKSENERWKKDNNENIIEPKIPTVPFGSFCCILKKGTEYFILTAGHNLGNNPPVGKEFKLIKDKDNYVELVLIRDYRILIEEEEKENDNLKKKNKPLKYFKKDTAILKITKCNGVDSKDFNNKLSNGKLKIETLDFYINAIKFENKYYTENSNVEKGKEIGYIVSYKAEIDKVKFENEENCKPNEADSNYPLYRLNKKGSPGNSGGVVFSEISGTLKILGNYIGIIETKGYCTSYYNLSAKENYFIV